MPNLEMYPKTVVLREGTRAILRPLEASDKLQLWSLFERVPEEERYYLKENVTAPEVIRDWTSNIDFSRVIPIVAVAEEQIVADATLHRGRSMAKRHLGEIRVVADPEYREKGLGARLIREILDIAADLRLHKVTFELVAHREKAAIMAAENAGFEEVAVLSEWVRDIWGNYEDLVLLEFPVKERELWWRF